MNFYAMSLSFNLLLEALACTANVSHHVYELIKIAKGSNIKVLVYPSVPVQGQQFNEQEFFEKIRAKRIRSIVRFHACGKVSKAQHLLLCGLFHN